MRKRILDYVLIFVAFSLVALVGFVAFVKSRDQSRRAAEFVIQRSTSASTQQDILPSNLSAAAEALSQGTELQETAQTTKLEETHSTETLDLREVFDPAVAFGLEMEQKLDSQRQNQPQVQEPAAAAAMPAAVSTPDPGPEISSVQVSETINVPFETEYQESDLLPQGEEAVIQQGYDAIIEVDYEQTYVDGVLQESREIGRRYLASGQPHIVMIGTGLAVEEEEPMQQAPAEVPEYSEEDLYEPEFSEDDTDLSDTTTPVPGVADISFVGPGSNSAAESNFYTVASLLNRNGAQNYVSFSDNNNGTITVDGVTFAVASGPQSFSTTSYDGYECYTRSPGPGAINECNRTASGLLAQRGIVAASQGGYPMGTVLFIEGYGLAVVGDRHGMGSDLLDLAFDAREISQGVYLPTGSRTVYVLQ